MAETQFPLNLPLSFRNLSPCGCDLHAHLGESISGVGVFLKLYDRWFPAVGELLVRCVGDGIGKRTVELIATIVITLIALPVFCSLTLLYNVIAGCIKGAYGLKEYLSKSDEDGSAEAVDAKCTLLFKEASKHLCFGGMDLIGVTAVCWLFAGAFAFGGTFVKDRYVEAERAIRLGKAYDKIVEWVQTLRGIQPPPATELTSDAD